MAEQDVRSPHRYYYACFDEKQSWTVFDLGAAEGIFTLSVIDKIEKAYLFECEEQWQQALRATFQPYGDKVEIVSRYVSDKETDNTISLDTFMKDKPFACGYVKMDIEGAELSALKGAGTLLKESKIQFVSACAYHSDEAGKDISEYLENNRYICSYSSGVMAFGDKAPYFRRGMVYAKKDR
ncbi:MAG: FkbM family methyltransferase [Bacteroidales bacterium]|nr:FkbM family methyltransferase [Bacteroidales bacterium]